ncbi:MAG: hypothetical protein EBY43_05200 [Opitutae bacterium]|nr:hypothetical protein [Opitutae bacterium]
MNKGVHSFWAESEQPKSRHAKKKDRGLGRKFIGYVRSSSDFRVVKTILFTRAEKPVWIKILAVVWSMERFPGRYANR